MTVTVGTLPQTPKTPKIRTASTVLSRCLSQLCWPAGNEPAALVNAVLGNIIGIFITPLWLSHFLDVQGAAPYAAVLIELTYTIIGPLIVGQLMQYLTPKLVSEKVMSGGQPRPATTHTTALH